MVWVCTRCAQEIVLKRHLELKTRTMHVKALCGEFWAARAYREVDSENELIYDDWRMPPQY